MRERSGSFTLTCRPSYRLHAHPWPAPARRRAAWRSRLRPAAAHAVLPSNSDDATKLRYYTPSFAGFQLGLSWTPNTEDDGDELAPKDVPIGD
jgi:hypothetical protein